MSENDRGGVGFFGCNNEWIWIVVIVVVIILLWPTIFGGGFVYGGNTCYKD